MFNRYPAFLRSLMGRLQFSKFMLRKTQQAARRSQERKYAGDWVYEVVVGDGQPFNFGIDYTECAIVKFMDAQGANELTPYLCNTDYVFSKAMGTGLRRTMTLAWGCEKCDFRYVKGGETQDVWPPKFVERYCEKISIG
jgi:ribosomal protein L37AE/L43A